MLWALTSAKGSPGVTTTALALVAAASASSTSQPGPTERALLVEADPAGGDLECWCGPLGEPGLLAAVTDVRDGVPADRLWSHAVEAVPGVEAIVAPTTEPSVTAALGTASDGFTEAIAGLAGTVVVDLGRWVSPGSTHANRLVREAATVVVVCRSSLASVEHTRSLVASLRPTTQRVALVMVGGGRPYPPEEVSAAVGVPVAGVLPWDPPGVGALVERGASRSWARSPLASAATELADALRHLGSAHRTGSIRG